MIRTYAVGRANSAVRRDNHLGLWTDLFPIGGQDTLWRDVMSDPSNPDKVVIVGGQNDGFNIQVSLDAGGTWVVPGGNWPDCNHFYEVWITEFDSLVSNNVIWAAGTDGKIVRSIDGGLNFNLTTAQPGVVTPGDMQYTAAIHAIDSNIAIVLGSINDNLVQAELYVWKTIDAGATWVLLSGASLPPPILAGNNDIGNANGIWISPNQQKIVVGSSYNQYLSLDGGTTWTDPLTAMQRAGAHLTWFPAYDTNPQYFRHIGGGTYQVNQSTDAGLSYTDIRSTYIGNTFLQILGAHFYAPYDGYYAYHDQGITYIDHTTDGAATGTVSHTNLDPQSSYEAIWTSVEQPPFTPCFELTDCAGLLQPIYTQTDLSTHDGEVITLADSTNHEIEGCWLVTATNITCPDTVEVAVYKCYDDCESCLPPEPPIQLPCPRPVDPGYNTGLCDPQIVEDILCSFSEMMYQQMMSNRFKIDYCCLSDEEALIIKYEKIKLKLRESESLVPDPCDPECHSYEIQIDGEDSAVTTYIDCFEVAQTIITAIDIDPLALPRTVGFCALDTTPPTSVVTHPDTSSDTYILERVADCVPPWVDPRACIGYTVNMSNQKPFENQSFRYLDCDGIEVIITKIGGQNNIAQYNFCGLEGQTIVRDLPSLPGDVFNVTEGPCTGLPPCVEYLITLNSSTGGTFEYTDCNGIIQIEAFVAQKLDQAFVVCGIQGQYFGCTSCNYFNAIENGNCY